MDVETKIRFVSYVPCATGGLSILGSCMTLLTIYRTRLLGTRLTTFHRLMVGISIFDLILSTAMVLGPLPMPAEMALQGFPSARGTTASCTWQGFFLTLGLASFGLNSMLMLHYVLVIRYNVSDEIMVKRFEPYMLAIPCLFHLGTSLTGLFWEIYNPNAPWCWIGSYPRGCWLIEQLECTRGDKHHEDLVALWFVMVPLTAWSGMIVICSLIVAATVLQRHCQSRRFVFRGSPANQSQNRQTRGVVVQCFLYGFTFFNSTAWTSMNYWLTKLGLDLDFMNEQFWIIGLALFFLPLQGCFTFLIFIRLRYLANRSSEEYRDQGPWMAFRQAVWNPKPPSSNRRFVPTNSRASQRGFLSSTSRLVSSSGTTTGGAPPPSSVLPATGVEQSTQQQQQETATN